MDDNRAVTRIYTYPANTTPNEKPATFELLSSQQREIDDSIRRRDKNMKNYSEGVLTVDTAKMIFIFIVILSLMSFFSLLYISSRTDATKDITDSVSNRLVDKVQNTSN